MFYRQILFIILSSISLSLTAQTGKEFWFVVPYIDKTHDSDNNNGTEGVENFFRISTGEAGANVTFYYYPGGGSANEQVLHTVYVPGNSVENVQLKDSGGDISLSGFTSDTYETITDQGIYITSSSPITVYYEVGSYNNTDIFSLKGKDALGTEFFPTFQNKFDNYYTGTWAQDSWETVDIVATEDDTEVTIQLPASTSGGSTDPDTVYTTINSDTVYTISQMIRPKDATTCYIQGGGITLYTISVELTYKDGVFLSKTDPDTTWAIDTTTDYCCSCPGYTSHNAWWADPSNIVTITKFSDQYNPSNITTSESNTTTTTTAQGATDPIVKFHDYSTTTITLDKGETYSLKAAQQTALKPFDGIIVTSNKPIAITQKDDSAADTEGGIVAADVIGDQIIPSDFAGTVYIFPDFNVGTPDMEQGVYIRAIEDGTEIYEEGGTLLGTIDKGEVYSYYDFTQSDSYKLIYTNDKPVMCFQVSGYASKDNSVTELCGAILPPVDECTGSTQAAFNIPSIAHGYKIAIISRTNDPGTFKYKQEGSATWTDFSPAFTAIDTDNNGSDDWYFTLDPGFTPTQGQNYLIKNTNATFHLGVLSGVREGTDSYGGFYGYFSDFTSPELQLGFDTLANGQVQLFAFGGVEGSYEWNLDYPAPGASPSCTDQYFEDKPDCNKDNPIILSEDILDIDAYYIYGASGENTCDASTLTNTVSFIVKGKSAFLPVELSYVSVENCRSNTVCINWETSSETNNDFFTIERSVDGFSFDAAGTKKGAGSTSDSKEYAWTDKALASGVYFYRLKQTDYDGNYTYSEIISVFVEGESGEIVIFPTVIKEGELLKIKKQNPAQKLTVDIYAIDGRIISSDEYHKQNEFIYIQTNLPAGMYDISVETIDNNYRQRIIVNK